MNVTIDSVQRIIGTKINPRNLSLYQRAFTHKSALKEHPHLSSSYETLEFIGDSVLGFVITRWLFDKYEQRQEGFLTKARTKLVRGETLAGIARKLGLQHHVLMDSKGLANGWVNNDKILEDCFEALVGAIYQDIGLLHAKAFILNIFEDARYVDMKALLVDDNFKDYCMRFCQKLGYELPDYRMMSHEDGMFTVDVWINGAFGGRGSAKTKKGAEQLAARDFFSRYSAT